MLRSWSDFGLLRAPDPVQAPSVLVVFRIFSLKFVLENASKQAPNIGSFYQSKFVQYCFLLSFLGEAGDESGAGVAFKFRLRLQSKKAGYDRLQLCNTGIIIIKQFKYVKKMYSL